MKYDAVVVNTIYDAVNYAIVLEFHVIDNGEWPLL